MKHWRLLITISATVVGLLLIRSGLAVSQAAADLPAPHIGYGANVRLNLDMIDGLGLDWIKLYEDLFASPADFPAGSERYHILYRIEAYGWPASLENYLAHVKQLAIAGKGKVAAYEVGNEPNLWMFWGEQSPDPKRYGRLLCNVYATIKSVDPNASVISAGLAPVGRTSPTIWNLAMDDQVFTHRLFDTMRNEFPTLFPCFDGFGYHPQGFPYPPEISYAELEAEHPDDNGNGLYFRASEYYHALMVGYGIGDHPIWLTEFGWVRDPLSDPWDGDPPYTTYGWCDSDHDFAPIKWMRVTEQQQADYLVRAFQYADANMPWIGPMFLFNSDWNSQGWYCASDKFFSIYKATTGLPDTDPRAKVKSLAFQAVANLPKRYVLNTPTLSAQPDRLIFLTEVATPTIQTRTFQLINPQAISWTLSISGSIVQPLADPMSGTQAATITISIDPSPIGFSGTYSASLFIIPNPITASNSITIPISIIAVDHLNTLYLPMIQSNYVDLTPPPTSTTHFTGGMQLGVNFVSSAEQLGTPVRYQRAADLKAAFNRRPMYWPQIETDPINHPRSFNWAKQDASIISDTLNGLQVLPILMLTPTGLDTGGSQNAPTPKVGDGLRLQMNTPDQASSPSSQASPPIGLYAGIFANGIITDDVPGKPINPNNRWAIFVNAAVNRYKPGGTLAQAQGWISTTGVTHWEIWNEEDLNYFFSGTITDYARLMKVAYLSAKSADPNAEIVFGGMAHFQKPNWLKDVLSVIATDPLSLTYHGYADAVASHSYAWSWQTFNYLYQDRLLLDVRGFKAMRLWLTETGVPVCDDPAPNANPPLDPFCPSLYRSTMNEQAAYLIQTLTFAQWLNTETALWFQLYDDCGNDGRYDAHGLVRNPASGPCTPRDGTNRVSFAAYQTVVNQLLGAQPYWRKRPTTNQELIAFKRTDTNERVVVMWARSNVTETVVLSATASAAQLIFPNGSSQAIFPTNGVYTITLPAATNYSTATNDGSAAIGGDPRILIENDPNAVP